MHGRDLADGESFGVEPREQRDDLGRRAVGRHLEVRSRRSAALGSAGPLARAYERAIGELERRSPPTARLELGGGALGDDPAAVEHRDRSASSIGLLEVLGGEQDRHAFVDQRRTVRPRACSRLRGSRPVVGSSRNSSRGRSIMLIARSSRRRHPAGVRAGAPVGGVGEVELASSSVDALRGRPCGAGGEARAIMAGSRSAGQHLVDGGVLAGEADRALTPIGSVEQVVAGDRRRAGVGREQVARMRTIVVLPAPLGPSRAKTEPASTARSTPSSATARRRPCEA